MKDSSITARGRSDQTRDRDFGSPGIHRTTSVFFESVEQAVERRANVWNSGPDAPYSASFGTPASHALEDLVTSLEAGAGSVALPTGQAAIASAICAFVKAGDAVLLPDNAYGVAKHFASTYLAQFGIAAHFYDPMKPETLDAARLPETRLLYIESPGSLTFEIADIASLIAYAREHGLLTVCDNTWATPLGCKPLAQGADVSLLSLSKSTSGHADVYLGTVTARTQEHYLTLRKYVGYLGYYADPEACFLALRGIKTLPLRLERQQRTALEIVEFLSRQPEVDSIHYPAWPGDPFHALWKTQFTGAPGLFSLSLHPEQPEVSRAFINALVLFDISVGWGGTSSLAWPIDPVSLRQMGAEGVRYPNIRMFVGLEDPRDLMDDLANAFAFIRKSKP